MQAGGLERPTLIIWGYNDPSATYDMGVDLFKLISSSVDEAQLHLFNKCGHAPYHVVSGLKNVHLVGTSRCLNHRPMGGKKDLSALVGQRGQQIQQQQVLEARVLSFRLV